MKVLVVGAAGFVGRHACRHLLGAGHEVVGFDLDALGCPNDAHAASWSGRRCDWTAYPSGLECRDADAILHLAAWPYDSASFKSPVRACRDALLPLARSCEVAAKFGVRRIVYASSIAVYGIGDMPAPWDEETATRPVSPYGIAKLAGEHVLRSMAGAWGFEPVILRFGQLYGEGSRLGDRLRDVVSIFMFSLLRGEPMSVSGDGEQLRSFLHVDDLCPVLERACSGDGPRLCNVASPEAVSINELAALVAGAGGFNPAIVRPKSKGTSLDAFLDAGLAVREFGLKSRALRDGLTDMWAWARGQTVPQWLETKLPLNGATPAPKGAR